MFIFSEPDVVREVKQKLDLGSVKFEVWKGNLHMHLISFYYGDNLGHCVGAHSLKHVIKWHNSVDGYIYLQK